MTLTYRIVKGVDLTPTEVDNNFLYSDKKLTLSTIAQTTTDEDSENFTLTKSLWLNITDGKFYRPTDLTTDAAVWSEIVITQLATHIADDTKHRIINDTGTLATELFSASKIISDFLKVGTVDTTANRPATPKIGQYHWDTDLVIPIWFNGTNWTNSVGATV